MRYPTGTFIRSRRSRRTLLVTGMSLVSLLSITALVQAQDSDGDGLVDTVDLCPAENSSFFDANADGCIDPTANARHIEYWASSDLPLHYSIHASGAPIISDGSDFSALQAAMNEWGLVAGVHLSAVYDGSTPQFTGGFDGLNLITFEDPDFAAVYGNAVIAVGVTTSYIVPTVIGGKLLLPGQIVDADMMFNPNRTFATDSGGIGVDLSSVAVHEAGHLFGLSHSVVETATMFPALPAGQRARSLESDDRVAIFMAYPDPALLATSTSLSGTVTRGSDGLPVPGAAVFAINASTGDSSASQYTLPDGTYQFVGLDPGDYTVAVHPLDGSAGIKGVTPAFINALVDSTAQTLFTPESWNLAESAADDPAAADVVTLLAAAKVSAIDIITNTDTVAPQVVDWQPASSTADNRNDAVVLIRYDEAIDFNSTTTRFHLDRIDTGVPAGVGGSLLLLPDEKTLIFNPNVLLVFGATYRVTLDAGVTDLFLNPTLSPFITEFTVEPSPAVALTSVSPRKGVGGALVVLGGVGFDTTVGANSVLFGTQVATVVDASASELVVRVPALTAADVAITVGVGAQTSAPLLFTVLDAQLSIRGNSLAMVGLSGVPSEMAVLPDNTFAYVATDAGVSVVSLDPTQADYLNEIASIPVPGGIDGVAATPDGARVYAVSRADRQLLVIDAGYGDLNNRSLLFNRVLNSIPMDSNPLGVAIDPAGLRAFVPTLQGDILIWDVLKRATAGSSTFHQQVGVVATGSPDLSGKVSFDPSGQLMLILRNGGHLLVFDRTNGNAQLADVSVGLDPRGVTTDPMGQNAYVSDASGQVTVVELATLSPVQTIAVGGSLRAIEVAPTGTTALVVDRVNDAIGLIDLQPGTPSFRTLSETIVTGANPVDVELAPDGFYIYALEQSASVLEVFSVGSGPVLNALNPSSAMPGDTIMLIGEGFTPLNYGQPVVGVHTAVDFDGIPGVVVRSTSTAIEVIVPDGFAGGPVRARQLGAPAQAGVPPDPFSNPHFLNLLSPSPSGGAFTDRVFFGPSLGYDWGTGMDNSLAVSPNGEFVAFVRSEKELVFFAANPANPQYHQAVATLDLGGNHAVDTVVFGADSRTVYTSNHQGVDIVDSDPLSPTFATSLGVVDFSPVTALFSSIEPHCLLVLPEGETLLVNNEDGGIIMVDLRPGVDQYRAFAVVAETGSPGELSDVVAHPGGRFVYATSTEDSLSYLHIISTDPASANYLQEIALVNLPTAGRALTISPDGNRVFVATVKTALDAFKILELDASNASAPVIVSDTLVDSVPKHSKGKIRMLPNGQRLFVDTLSELVEFDISGGGIVEIHRLDMQSGKKYLGLALTPDARRVYTAAIGAAGPNMLVTGAASAIQILSGADQTGVAGTELPAPIRVRFVNTDLSPAIGQDVYVSVFAGSGLLENSSSSQVYVTDGQGVAEIRWTLGPVLTPNPPPPTPTHELRITLQNQTVGNQVVTIAATAVADPATLPLQLSDLFPPDGSTNIGVNTALQVGFSRAINPSSVNSTVFTLRAAGSPTPVAAVFGFANGNKSLSLIPLGSLKTNQSYEIELTTGIEYAAGGVLSTPMLTSFRTSLPQPASLGSVNPSAGAPGAQITIGGSGFHNDPTQNRVFFGAVSVLPANAGSEFLQVTVPFDAVSGSIRVESQGVASNPIPFTVLTPTIAPLNTIVETIDTGVPTQTAAITPDGARAYTVSGGTNQVIPLDLVRLVPGTPIPVGNNPVAVVITPDGTTAYVANFVSGSLSVIDLATDTVVRTIPVGANPFNLVMSPDGNKVYVVNLGDQTLSVVDSNPTSATYQLVLASVPTGASTKGAAITPDGTKLYLGISDGFLIMDLDPSGYGVLASVPTGASTKGAAITPDGTLLILVTGAGDVLIIDLAPGANHQVLASVPTGASTKGAAITPDGSLIYLFQENSDDILVISLNISSPVGVVGPLGPGQSVTLTLTVVDTITTIPDPVYIVFDPSGSGLGIVGEGSTNQVTLINYLAVPTGPLSAAMAFDVRPLTLPSMGRYPEARISLPPGFFAEDVQLLSVRLSDGNGGAPAVAGREFFEDVNQDGRTELVLRFERPDFELIFPSGDSVVVKVQGLLNQADRSFSGTSTIQTQRPTLVAPVGGEHFYTSVADSNVIVQTSIQWRNDTSASVDSVSVHYSLDNGETWSLIDKVASGPNPGSVLWTLPELSKDASGRVSVIFYDSGGSAIGMTMNPTPFYINLNPVPVAFSYVDAFTENSQSVLRWALQTRSGAVGFHVWRSEQEGSAYRRLTDSPVWASTSSAGDEFEYRDPDIVGNHNYWYQLEEATRNGDGLRFGPYLVSYVVANSLEPNYPNSFNPRTTIRYSVADKGHVRLVVYDVVGRRVRTLVNEVLDPNNYSVVWEGTDDRGSAVSSGIYLYRLEIAGFVAARKMALVR